MPRWLPVILLLTAWSFTAAPTLFAQVVVAGLTASKLEPELKGLVLIDELNCAACHTANASMSARAKKSPRLAEIGSRANPTWIEQFIHAPHAVKPGTTMPDLLGRLGDAERKQVATALTHYLMSLTKNDFSLQPGDAVAARLGERLFHARGCASCHSPRDAKGIETAPEDATGHSTPLGALERKYSFKSLVAFLRNPHASRPSGRMPDLRLQGQDVERIAHFLLQGTRVPGALTYTLYRGQVWEGLGSEKVKPERAGQVKDFALSSLGNLAHHTAITYEGWLNIPVAGRYTFFLNMNGGSLSLDGTQIIKQDPSDRRGAKAVEGAIELAVGWRKIQLSYFHTGQKPAFTCEMAGPQFERQPIPTAMLSVSNDSIPALAPFIVDAGLAASGRGHFATFGCANCHSDLQVPAMPATALAKLDASRGCLSKTSGPWPRFDLTEQQRTMIATALPHAEAPALTDQHVLDKTLVTFNCLACHERAGLGGITPERNALFTGTQGALGDQGRLPPPLTRVGAKLNPDWLKQVLLQGKRQRGYLDASMPQFGEANVGHLVELFGKVDQLEAAPSATVANVEEAKNAGREMVGTSGFSCIACHEFNGQRSGEIGAVDIAFSTERLKKNWFHLYLRQPSRFHPTVIMPSYWPGGQSIRPNLLGGDTTQQIEALWTYLSDGTRAKRPIGLSRQSNELRVSDVAEICRGRSPIGYRGIAVGYPERISLSFDSEEMALRQLWKGDFANVDLGNFNPRGTDLVSFAAGIPFHRLKSPDDNWPYKGKTNYAFPQDQGYQFRGYRLDAQRRPTFLYLYGDIAVEDTFADVRDTTGKPFFKRTMLFTAPVEQTPFHFRAATGTKITTSAARTFMVDALNLRITSEHQGLIREGKPGEVLIPLTLPKGSSTLTLECQW